MGNILEAGISLTCGCCGTWFKTWKGYEDQGNDIGFGICTPCQEDQEADNKAHYDRMYNKILEAVQPDTRDKIEKAVAKDPKMKVVYVNMGMEQGWFEWGIK